MSCACFCVCLVWVQQLFTCAFSVNMPVDEWMNENLYIAHKNLPHKTLRVHSARYTQCIHVSSRKLKLPKDTHTKKYKQLLPTHHFPKVELYIAVKCKNIYRVTNNDNRKKNYTHTHTQRVIMATSTSLTHQRKRTYTIALNFCADSVTTVLVVNKTSWSCCQSIGGWLPVNTHYTLSLTQSERGLL